MIMMMTKKGDGNNGERKQEKKEIWKRGGLRPARQETLNLGLLMVTELESINESMEIDGEGLESVRGLS